MAPVECMQTDATDVNAEDLHLMSLPTYEELIGEICELGFATEQSMLLMELLRETAELIDPDTGDSGFCDVNRAVHDVLDAIMPDLAYAAPGSLHERLNHHFLPEGWGFMHDRHGYCTLQAIPL